MTEQIGRFYEFGPFRMDAVKRLLLRDGEPVFLTPKVFDTLLALVENSGRILEKDELMQKVWPDVIVEEGNLAHNISALRKALGESHDEHRYLVTIPGRGYRFVASVREVSDQGAELIVQERTRSRITVEEEEVSGRDEAGPAFEERALARNSNSGRGMRAAESASASVVPATEPLPEYPVSKTKPYKRGTVVALAIFAVTVAGIAFALYKLIVHDRYETKLAGPFQKMQIKRLTTAGKSVTAAISPDGKFVAHVMKDAGQQSLWVRQVATASHVQIVPPAAIEYWGLTFSNDGNYVYYVAWEWNKTGAALHQIPTLGGASPRMLISGIGSPISFSPDGEWFVYVFNSSILGESRLMVAKVDGTEQHKLATRKHPEIFAMHPVGPAWSPDGKIIVCAAGNFAKYSRHVNLLTVKIQDGTEKILTSQSWLNVGRIAWLKDGSGLIMTARDQMSSGRQLWRIAYPRGEAQRITNDVNDYSSVSLTADSKILGAVRSEQISGLWIAPNGDASRAKQVTSEVANYEGVEGMCWTPDGKIVYRSNASGNWEIWIMEPDGTCQKRLTFDSGTDLHPSVSPDGRYIVFASDRTGSLNIWRMDIDGGNLKRLTSGSSDARPQCSPDGQWVIYQQGFGLGKATLWKVPMDGGESVQLTDKMSLRPAISPDGKLIAYYYMDAQVWGLAVIPFAGGQPIRRFNISPKANSRVVRWTPDGQALAYIEDHGGVSNIWIQPLEGGPAKQLTDFKSDRMFYFDWSRDGKLACTRGVETHDVVLISNFK